MNIGITTSNFFSVLLKEGGLVLAQDYSYPVTPGGRGAGKNWPEQFSNPRTNRALEPYMLSGKT